MKCEHCGAEITRIPMAEGPVDCWADSVMYWDASNDNTRELLTPNGERVRANLTGDTVDAAGFGYLPHICGTLPLIFAGRDSWSRPVYLGPNDQLYVDVDPIEDRGPEICTKYQNAFDGEPCDPVAGDFDFIPCRDTWY